MLLGFKNVYIDLKMRTYWDRVLMTFLWDEDLVDNMLATFFFFFSSIGNTWLLLLLFIVVPH